MGILYLPTVSRCIGTSRVNALAFANHFLAYFHYSHDDSTGYLVHETGSTISVSVNTWVQLVSCGRVVVAVADFTEFEVVLVVVMVVDTNTRVWSAGDTVGAGFSVRSVMTWKNLFDSSHKLLIVRSGSTIILLMSVALAASDHAARLGELIKSLHGQSRNAMMLRRSVVGLMNGDNSVDNLWLDSLLMDDGLDSLVHMVMDVLTSDCGSSSSRVGCVSCGGSILELTKFSAYSAVCLFLVVMSEFALNLGQHVMDVLFWKNLLVSDGLYSSVVVVLVDLSVNCLNSLLMDVRLDNL